MLVLLQGSLAVIIAFYIIVLSIAAVRYARASAAERVLIAPAPEGDNIIQLRNYRLKASGSNLRFQAHHNPSRGGNA